MTTKQKSCKLCKNYRPRINGEGDCEVFKVVLPDNSNACGYYKPVGISLKQQKL